MALVGPFSSFYDNFSKKLQYIRHYVIITKVFSNLYIITGGYNMSDGIHQTFIVAVVGMCGAGKSVFTNYFIDAGWPSIYFGGVTMEILEQKKLPKIQIHEKEVRESLRAEHGMEAFAKILYPRIDKVAKTQNVILDGLYSWAEYKYLKDKFGSRLIIIAIITDRQKRYQRLTTRPLRPLTLEEAALRDYYEIENLDKGGPIAIADYYVYNNELLEDLELKYHSFCDWLKNK